MIEIWKPVVGYETGYEVSNHGRVRRTKSGRIKKTTRAKGYLAVGLCLGGRMKTLTVHKLVATAFIREPRLGEQVRHLDGNKDNNSPANLAWGTAKENSADRDRHGRTIRGERSPLATKTLEQVVEIKKLQQSGLGCAAIGRIVGLSRSRVHEVMRGRIWRHVGLDGVST